MMVNHQPSLDNKNNIKIKNDLIMDDSALIMKT